MNTSQYKSIEYKFKDQRFFEEYYSLYSIGWEYWADPNTYYRDCRVAPERQCVFQYTVSGEGILICDRKMYTIKPGQAFLIERPGRYQYYRNPKASHWEIQFISFNMASLKVWRDITDQFGRIVEIPKNSSVLQYWEHIYEIAIHDEMKSFFLASGYAYQFMMQLYDTLSNEAKKGSTSDLVQNCVNLIQTNYKEELDLQSLAVACGCSVPYLSKRFKASLQTSPIQYLNRHRIEIACSLLLRGNMRIEDVAHDVGFFDVNYFCRVFKKMMGVTPKVYREQEISRIVEDQTIRLQVTPPKLNE